MPSPSNQCGNHRPPRSLRPEPLRRACRAGPPAPGRRYRRSGNRVLRRASESHHSRDARRRPPCSQPAFPNDGRSLSHLHAQIVGTIEAAKALRPPALVPSRARIAMAYRIVPARRARAAGEGSSADRSRRRRARGSSRSPQQLVGGGGDLRMARRLDRPRCRRSCSPAGAAARCRDRSRPCRPCPAAARSCPCRPRPRRCRRRRGRRRGAGCGCRAAPCRRTPA